MSTHNEFFSTAELPQDVVELLKKAEASVHSALELQGESVFAIGADLAEVKKRLDRGIYGLWIAARFPFSIRTAQNYTSVHDKLLGDQQVLQHFAPTTLYALASKSSDGCREQIITEVKNGVLKTDEKVRDRIAELTPITAPDPEKVEQRESNYVAAVTLFSRWSPSKLEKLIAMLRVVDAKVLADRLEKTLGETSNDEVEASSSREQETEEPGEDQNVTATSAITSNRSDKIDGRSTARLI